MVGRIYAVYLERVDPKTLSQLPPTHPALWKPGKRRRITPGLSVHNSTFGDTVPQPTQDTKTQTTQTHKNRERAEATSSVEYSDNTRDKDTHIARIHMGTFHIRYLGTLVPSIPSRFTFTILSVMPPCILNPGCDRPPQTHMCAVQPRSVACTCVHYIACNNRHPYCEAG